MIARIVVSLFTVPWLLCCSSSGGTTTVPPKIPLPEFLATPLVPPPPERNTSAELVLLEQEFEAYLPNWGDPEFRGQICQAGTSCLSMDDRPFQVCLLSSSHCGDLLRESARRGEHLGMAPPVPAR